MTAILNYSIIEVTTAAGSWEPVTVGDAKRQLQISRNDDDEMIRDLIGMARDELESRTRRTFRDATFTIKMDEFPRGEWFQLMRPPVRAVSSITYLDNDGASQPLSTSVYELDINRWPGAVWLQYDQTWPTTRAIQNAVTATYTAGYATPSDVPVKARQALLRLVQLEYDGCEENDRDRSLIDSLKWGAYA